MNKPQEIASLFTETDALGSTKLKAVSIRTTARSQDELLARLDRGLTAWMQDTDEGKDAWDRSGQLFNIDHVLGCCGRDGTPIASLRPYLEKEGVFQMKEICHLNAAEQVSYDRILAHPPEI